MRHTRSATRSRRSHHALAIAAHSVCPRCRMPARPHAVCANCGSYKGRQVIDVLAKLDKKTRKKKEKELRAHEQGQVEKGETLSASELSRR